MKVVFLQPPSPPGMNVKRDYAGGMGVADPSDRTEFGHDPGYITLPYMSLLYSAAVCERAGHDVTFVDAQAENLGVEALSARLDEVCPEAIVSVVNLPSVYGDIEVGKTLRKRSAGTKLIAIGTVAEPLFDLLVESEAFDAVVTGDPEVILPELLEDMSDTAEPGSVKFVSKSGVVTNTQPGRIMDLDALPDLPYHLLNLERYWYHGFGKDNRFAAVFSSRGCSFKCYYCPYPVGFGDNIVYRDIGRVVSEIENLNKRYGVTGILFRDQVFSMDRERTMRLCDEIIRRGLKIDWVIETRLDRVDEALLRKMKDAGCKRIHYGIESGDPEMFTKVGKDGVEANLDTLVRNFLATERVGIHPHMFTLIGLLGETKSTVQSTIDLIKRIKPLTLQVAVVTPYPSTRLYDQMKEKGLIETEDWSQYTGFTAVARTEELSRADLMAARALMVEEHAGAVRWKKRRQLFRLSVKYLCDGSLIPRLLKKVHSDRTI